jgi:hypothetical protein
MLVGGLVVLEFRVCLVLLLLLWLRLEKSDFFKKHFFCGLCI